MYNALQPLCTLLSHESVFYSVYVHVCANAYLLAPAFTDYHTMNDLNIFPFCDNLGPYLQECVIITCWQNIVGRIEITCSYFPAAYRVTCLVVVEYMWCEMSYSMFYRPLGLLVAPPRASCLSHEARRWSWICTTRMIWPRMMRTWAGERWKVWWHSCNSLPQGGHHEQMITWT